MQRQDENRKRTGTRGRDLTLPYELRLGVTGHRQLLNKPAVSIAVRRLLNHLDGVSGRPKLCPLFWTIVSPLAVGADRIVAEAVMERSGARLEAVLPFPVDEYEKDFETEDDLLHFARLLKLASTVTELGLRTNDDCSKAQRGENDRTAEYLRVGHRVVDLCKILIAVWDGSPAAGIGGTADIVRYALTLNRIVLWIDPQCPDARARLFRSVSESPVNGDGRRSVETADLPDELAAISEGYCEQETYCRDRAIRDHTLKKFIREFRNALSHEMERGGLASDQLEHVLEPLIDEYVRADALAEHYQRRHLLVVNGVPELAAFGVTVATAQILFFPDRLWLIAFEVPAMLAIFGLWWCSHRYTWHRKWLQCRFLAERLRTSLFTTIVHAQPSASLKSPLPFYRGPHQWLTRVVLSLSSNATRDAPQQNLTALRRFLTETWLKGQREFHENNASHNERSAVMRHKSGRWLFGGTLLMAFLHLLGIGHASAPDTAPVVRLDIWIAFLALVFPFGQQRFIPVLPNLSSSAFPSGRNGWSKCSTFSPIGCWTPKRSRSSETRLKTWRM